MMKIFSERCPMFPRLIKVTYNKKDLSERNTFSGILRCHLKTGFNAVKISLKHRDILHQHPILILMAVWRCWFQICLLAIDCLSCYG